MSEHFYSVGLNHVGSYQVSGYPFVSGTLDCSTATDVQFPYVTRWVKVQNNDTLNDCRVGFSQTGVEGTNFFILPKESQTECLELRVSEIWISGSSNISVIAGITNIPAVRMGQLTGPGIDE